MKVFRDFSRVSEKLRGSFGKLPVEHLNRPKIKSPAEFEQHYENLCEWWDDGYVKGFMNGFNHHCNRISEAFCGNQIKEIWMKMIGFESLVSTQAEIIKQLQGELYERPDEV